MRIPRFEVFKDAKGEWRWRLRSGNNKIIATSGEGYKNKADCTAGLDLARNSFDCPLCIIKDE